MDQVIAAEAGGVEVPGRRRPQDGLLPAQSPKVNPVVTDRRVGLPLAPLVRAVEHQVAAAVKVHGHPALALLPADESQDGLAVVQPLPADAIGTGRDSQRVLPVIGAIPHDELAVDPEYMHAGRLDTVDGPLGADVQNRLPPVLAPPVNPVGTRRQADAFYADMRGGQTQVAGPRAVDGPVPHPEPVTHLQDVGMSQPLGIGAALGSQIKYGLAVVGDLPVQPVLADRQPNSLIDAVRGAW